MRASAGQPAEAGPARVTSLPPSPAPLSLAPCLPAVSRVGFGTLEAGPPMPAKGAVGLDPCLPGSRHLPFPRPAPHLRAASAAMRSPCARPCSLSQRRILGDAQARPAEPRSADLVVVKPAHRSAGCLTLSFGNGLCSLLLSAPQSRAEHNPDGVRSLWGSAVSLPARTCLICILAGTGSSLSLDSFRHR